MPALLRDVSPGPRPSSRDDGDQDTLIIFASTERALSSGSSVPGLVSTTSGSSTRSIPDLVSSPSIGDPSPQTVPLRVASPSANFVAPSVATVLPMITQGTSNFQRVPYREHSFYFNYGRRIGGWPSQVIFMPRSTVTLRFG